MSLSQDKYYAYLTDSNELANRLADDILRLAPRPDVEDDPETTGMYLQTVDGRAYVLRPFIDDSRLAEFPPDEPRARFYLGIAVSHLEAFKDPEFYLPIPYDEVTTVGIEGSSLDQRVIDTFELQGEKKNSKVRFPLRLRASEGEEDVFDITTPLFEPLRASKAFLRGFYERWNIPDLDRHRSWVLDANAIREAREAAGIKDVLLPAVNLQEATVAADSNGSPYTAEDQRAWEESFAYRTPPEEI